MMLFSRKPESSPSGEPTPEPISPPPPPATWDHLPPAPRAPAEHGESYQGLEGSGTQSFIDASLTIVGDIHAEGDVRLDGRVCGNVRCAQLIVGKDAVITGAVTAAQVIIRGRIMGTIRSPVVIIQATAHVESEVTYGVLAIDDGATFEGKVHRSDNPLAEMEAIAPFEELQQMARAAKEPSGAGNGHPADGMQADAAVDTAAEATRADAAEALASPLANGHDKSEHRQAAPRS